MVDGRHGRGLIDTSIAIDLEVLEREALPIRLAISTLTLAELAAGPEAAEDAQERVNRKERLRQAQDTFEAIPFDSVTALAYRAIYRAVLAAGRKARGRRTMDLLIAATAAAHGLPLYTRNPDDFKELTGLVEIIAVPAPAIVPEDD